MKAFLRGQIQHMAQADILAMVPPDTIARLKLTDKTPEIRAYAIAHEGEARGTMVGVGPRVMQYFRDAILRLHDRLRIGTPIFHHHGATNDHSGRESIGELVGKALRNIDGKMHDIAAVYIPPKHRQLPLDVASIEAEVEFTDDGDGRCTAVNIGEITGIALASSQDEQPGFPGATLLAAIQAFAGEKDPKTMTKKEVQDAIKELGLKPGDLFDADTLKSDAEIEKIVKAEKQTEYEHAKRVETKLAKEREAWTAKETEFETKLAESETTALKVRAQAALDSIAKERKLTEAQKAFIADNFGTFETKATKEDALAKDVNVFVDSQIDRYRKYFPGAQKEGDADKKDADPGAPPGDTPQGGKDYSDPSVNDFIPATPTA